jgi:hypothetical protein
LPYVVWGRGGIKDKSMSIMNKLLFATLTLISLIIILSTVSYSSTIIFANA